jgi:hypothetical protein
MSESPEEKLDRWLAEIGCPYPAETLDSVIWLDGYRVGIAKAQAEVAAVAYNAAPKVRGVPCVIDFPKRPRPRPVI